MHKILKPVYLFAVFIIIVMVTAISLITSKPNDKIITNIFINNGIDINGSDSNFKRSTGDKPDYISIIFKKEEIKNIEIIESGYDFIKKKYFAIVNLTASSEDYDLNARAMFFLHYDKGWKLSGKIGVLYANFLVTK